MNVRSLKQYIQKLIGSPSDINTLGNSREPFFVLMNGKGTQSQVKQWVKGSASFASNAEEQLFYEFVQNAFDASADSLMFFANRKYLVVLNNGKPFYTDGDIFDDDAEVREGQLYNFLAKGKSLKSEDETSMGKYGQGSKLLYTLITDESDGKSSEDLLEEAIYDGHKGPYLISWANKHQLNELLNNTDGWQSSTYDDIEENILFSKILMSYYPVAPGEYPELFSEDEIRDVIAAFDELVDPRRNFSYLRSGTALLIPLGKGKYEKIMTDANLKKVRTRLGGFVSITKDQERNFGKHLDHIYVMKEEVEQQDVVSVFVDFNLDGKDFSMQFAFNPILHNDSYVNLFKGLPILLTKLNLGFIIDSQNFDVDDSRQRITDTKKTERQLKPAFQKLLEKLKEIKKADKDKYVYIYKSLLATSILKTDPDVQYVATPFREVFCPFFKENVLSDDGNFYPLDQCRYPSSNFYLPLAQLGISNLHWVDPDQLKNLKYHYVEVLQLGFADVLRSADPIKLEKYIKSLGDTEYREFQALCIRHMSDELHSLKLFKTNKKTLEAYSVLIGKSDIYFNIPECGNLFSGSTYVIEPLTLPIASYVRILASKIIENIESLRSNQNRIDDCCAMLSAIDKNSNFLDDKSFVRNKVALLKNWRGDYKVFSDLLSDSPEGSELFDYFKPKGYCPETARAWMTSGKAENSTIFWDWLCSRLEWVKTVPGWGQKTKRYLTDIRNAYGRQKNFFKKVEGFYLDQDGKPTAVQAYYLEKSEKLSKPEYNAIRSRFAGANIVPFEYKDILSIAPFGLCHKGVTDLVPNDATIDKSMLKSFSMIDDYLLAHYYFQEINSESFHIYRLNHGKNYADNDVPEKLQKLLRGISIFHIPQYVQSLYQNVKTSYSLIQNSDLMRQAINGVSDTIQLFPLVKHSNSTVVRVFFDKLDSITINGKLKESDLQWQVIEYGATNYSDEIYELISFNGEELPDEIVNPMVTVGSKDFNLYDLDPVYQTSNEIFDQFLACLPNEKCRDFFKDRYCSERYTSIDNSDLYETLEDQYLTIEQSRFCLSYLIDNGEDDANLELDSDISVSKFMDMIQANMFKDFDLYLDLPEYDWRLQVYAPDKYLLEDEKLPTELKNWLDKHKEGISLFNHLKTGDTDKFISIRSSIDNNSQFCFELDKAIDEYEKKKLDHTVEWLIKQNYKCAYASTRYYSLMQFIKALPDDYQTMPLLRFTGEVEQGTPFAYPLFKLISYVEGGLFFDSYLWSANQQSFLDLFKEREELRQFFINNTIYSYDNESFLVSHGLHKEPRLSIVGRVAKGVYHEWDHSVYKKWKASEASKGLSIMLSENMIGFNFAIESSNITLKSINVDNREYGWETGKSIVVKMPNRESLSVMDLIANHIHEMDTCFNAPFIALQAMFVSAYEDLESGNSVVIETDLPKDKVQDAVSKMTSETIENMDAVNQLTSKMEGQTLSKMIAVTDSIAELLNSLDADTINALNENKEKILDMLSSMREEDEPESKVRMTIGFIGEQIFLNYLNDLRDTDGNPMRYEYVADDNVGEYDFLLQPKEGKEIYVDVKTNLYTLQTGNAPFYIHKSQNKFMFDNPDADFRIVRISLKDLGIEHEYESIRDFFGADQDPRLNKELRSKCEDVAKKTWKTIKREFRSLSPEYGIKIEPVNE